MPWTPTSTSESLVSVSDYSAWYELGTPSTTDQARIQMALDMASQECRSYTSQQLTQTTDAVTIYPTTEGRLVLPEWPVTSITSLTVDDAAMTATSDYFFNDRGIVTPVTFCLLGWWKPRTVVVTYTHGWNPVPADIAEVCLSLSRRLLDAPSGQVVEAETIGSYSVRYGVTMNGLTESEMVKLDKYASWTVGY